MLPLEFRCPSCNARMTPGEAHVRVPYLRRHWWQFGDERSEYRCPGCGMFFVLRTGVAGLIGYAASIVAAYLAWRGGVNGLGAISLAAVGIIVVSRHALRLRPVAT